VRIRKGQVPEKLKEVRPVLIYGCEGLPVDGLGQDELAEQPDGIKSMKVSIRKETEPEIRVVVSETPVVVCDALKAHPELVAEGKIGFLAERNELQRLPPPAGAAHRAAQIGIVLIISIRGEGRFFMLGL